jgi:hypothetical protein
VRHGLYDSAPDICFLKTDHFSPLVCLLVNLPTIKNIVKRKIKISSKTWVIEIPYPFLFPPRL